MGLNPITRAEQIISGESLEPITREEMFLANAAGMDVDTPEPITRREMFLSMIQPGDGSGATIRNQNKTITENGQYKADSGYTGLGTVTVAVPETEPVLQDKELTGNGTYTADDGFDGLGEVVVNVPGSTAPVVEPLSVTGNGTYEAPDGVDGYSPVTVNVAGSTMWGHEYLSGTFTPSEDANVYTVATGAYVRSFHEASGLVFFLFDSTQLDHESSTSLENIKNSVLSYSFTSLRPGVINTKTLTYYSTKSANRVDSETFFVPYPPTYPIAVDFPFTLPTGVMFKANTTYKWVLFKGVN